MAEPGSAAAPDADAGPVLTTPRLRLRPFRDADLAPFAAMNDDPHVMENLLARLDRAESDAFAARIREEMRARGFGLWAVEVPAEIPFAGFVGLSVPRFDAAFTPCVEVGWRLTHACWGRGYAPEAARAALAHGFHAAGLEQIVSFTSVVNRASQRVMQKIGMTRDPSEDFDHPSVPPGHRLRRHVLYRIGAADFAG